MDLLTPIPYNNLSDGQFDLEPVKESFVLVNNSDKIVVDMQYAKQNIPYATGSCYIREFVYKLLIKATELLPPNYKFKIYDAWRPFLVQKWLFNHYRNVIEQRYSYLSPEELQKKIMFYVSPPSSDILSPPVHCTGGSIDLTIVDSLGNELDMGSKFDEFEDIAHTSFYEGSNNLSVKNNRRLLYNIMTSVGFTNLPSEWWHFDYGNKFWSCYKSSPIKYIGVFELEDVMKNCKL